MQKETPKRTVELAKDVRQALEADPEAKAVFEKMPYSHQNEYVKHIEEAKKPETRARRIESTVKWLLEKRSGAR